MEEASTPSEALRSYPLPSSPVRSPTGSDRVAVWVEESDGQQRVRMALTPPPLPVREAPGAPPRAAMPSTATTREALGAVDVGGAPPMDFPLLLCGETTAPATPGQPPPTTTSMATPPSTAAAATGSATPTTPKAPSSMSATPSAIVPFQKLQMDTNLHQTTLPTPSSPASSSSSSSSRSPSFASALRVDAATTSMTQEFMDALRLGDLRPQAPQLSVRLRGRRVELASASEDETVDFLGPAEDIKKLFKLPYSQDRVSLAVHRVGGTLVVDGELQDADLPTGFEDLHEEPKKIEQETEEQTQQLLYEKFIYQSTIAGRRLTHTDDSEATSVSSTTPPSAELPHTASPDDAVKAPIKKPKKRGKKKMGPSQAFNTTSPSTSRSSTQSHAAAPTEFDLPTFQRVLKWKFNDLKMILGSDVLLFSNPEHPAVSLRLHDMEKELSLCTVLDYYLDNVIANIPELAICMHSKGFVRGYKLVETRQIPYMSGTAQPLFDIQEVSMNASMLLKFLKENCSRPNGTYWLYRKQGENSLRLYDINVLSQGKQLKWKYMMAMLCHRFASRASRMMHSLAAESPWLQIQLRQRQRDLLRTCVTLLKEINLAGGSAHNSICASVSEQLADSYLLECHEQFSGLEHGYASDLPQMCEQATKMVETLEQARTLLHESIESFEKCMAVEDVAALPTEPEDKPLSDLNEGYCRSDLEDDAEDMRSFMRDELNRLRYKSSSVSLQLAHVHVQEKNWPAAVLEILDACKFLPIKSIPDHERDPILHCGLQRTSSKCHELVERLIREIDFDGVGHRTSNSSLSTRLCASTAELRCFILELVGDVASHQPHNVGNKLRSMYEAISGERLAAWDEIRDMDCGNNLQASPLLCVAFNSYLRALTPAVDSDLYFRLMKKLGNSCNEIGKHYLGTDTNYAEAFRWFERGCRVFNDIEDGINAALLKANMAHLHKILAQGKDAQVQESHYEAAVKLCKDAIQLFKQNRAEAELYSKVTGELALTYLMWAIGKSNRIPEKDENKRGENEVHRMFSKALSLYSELADAKQVASTHYQIASFYSRMISRDVNRCSSSASHPDSADREKLTSIKHRMEIARRHYEKAIDYFGKVELGKTFVLIHQELSDLYAFGGRIEDVDHALLILLNTLDAFAVNNRVPSEDGIMGSLAAQVIAKLQTVLLQLIRLSSSRVREDSSASGSAPPRGRKPEIYKQMYKEVIYFGPESNISQVLRKLRTLYLL